MGSDERCEYCDQPFGDTERADNHPAVRAWQLWTREGGTPRPVWKDVVAAVAADQPGMHTELTCFRVDWRSEARRLRESLALVERERDEAQGANTLNRTALTHAKAVCEEIGDYCFAANQSVLHDKEPIRKQMFYEIAEMARKGRAGHWESRELIIRDEQIDALTAERDAARAEAASMEGRVRELEQEAARMRPVVEAACELRAAAEALQNFETGAWQRRASAFDAVDRAVDAHRAGTKERAADE